MGPVLGENCVFVSRSSGNQAKQIGRGGRPVWCGRIYKPRTGLVSRLQDVDDCRKNGNRGRRQLVLHALIHPAPPSCVGRRRCGLLGSADPGRWKVKQPVPCGSQWAGQNPCAAAAWRPGSRWAARIVGSIFRTGSRWSGRPRRSWAVLDNARCGCGKS